MESGEKRKVPKDLRITKRLLPKASMQHPSAYSLATRQMSGQTVGLDD